MLAATFVIDRAADADISPPSGNLDKDAMAFMKQYFPREVKVKQKENEREVAKEDMEDAGMDAGCVIA